MNLFQKFRFKEHDEILGINLPEDLIAVIEGFSKIHHTHLDLQEQEDKIYHRIVIFASTRIEFQEYLNQYSFYLKPKVTLWLIYPKHFREENTHDFKTNSWNLLQHQEFDLVAATPLLRKYTALRFKHQDSIKTKYIGNVIEKNLLERHIDDKNQLVRLPIKARIYIKSIPGAIIYFHGLSFVARKQYILWLLEVVNDEAEFQKRVLKLTAIITKGMEELKKIHS